MSSTIFLIIALVTTGIFLIQFVLSIFFGDIDADVDVDADISSVVSFKGLTHLLKDLPISELDSDGTCIWRETRKFKVT